MCESCNLTLLQRVRLELRGGWRWLRANVWGLHDQSDAAATCDGGWVLGLCLQRSHDHMVIGASGVAASKCLDFHVTADHVHVEGPRLALVRYLYAIRNLRIWVQKMGFEWRTLTCKN